MSVETRGFRSATGRTAIGKRCGALLLALLFCALFFLPAAAEPGETAVPDGRIDPDHKGSVRVTVQDESGDLVDGGTLELYCVALLAEKDGAQIRVLTDAFSDWNGSVDELLSDHTSAESLAAFAQTNGTPCDASAEVANGIVTFTELSPGVYLILQKTAAEGYDAMLPFLTFLPQLSDDKIIYNVDAQPKPVEELPPGRVEILAQKEVAVISGTAPSDTSFSFVLTPITPDAPLPKNSSAVYNADKSAMTVSRRGAGTVSFGDLAFSAADAGATYEYVIREVRGSAAHYTYDTSAYKLSVSVSSAGKGSALDVQTEILDQSGNTVSSAVFRNTYDAGNSPLIPRTGQLWWPVIVMLPVGFALILLGFIFLRYDKDETEAEKENEASV